MSISIGLVAAATEILLQCQLGMSISNGLVAPATDVLEQILVAPSGGAPL